MLYLSEGSSEELFTKDEERSEEFFTKVKEGEKNSIL